MDAGASTRFKTFYTSSHTQLVAEPRRTMQPDLYSYNKMQQNNTRKQMATNTTSQTPKKSNNMTPQGTYNKEKRELLVSSAKNLQAFNGWVGGRSGSKNGNKKTENYNTSCDLDPPHTLAPRLPDVCEKKVFRFIHSSASGKQHLGNLSLVRTNGVQVMKVLNICGIRDLDQCSGR